MLAPERHVTRERTLNFTRSGSGGYETLTAIIETLCTS